MTTSLLAGVLGRGRSALGPSEGVFALPALDYTVHNVETLDGSTTLHTRVYGPAGAPVVVLVHGWTCRLEYWNPQINLLAERHRVVVYDQRGCGRSPAGDLPFTVDVLGDDLAAVLAATVDPKQPAVIVGHSMGGITVMAWAGRHASQVNRLSRGVILAATGAEGLVADTKVIPLAGALMGVREPLVGAVMGAPLGRAPKRLRRRVIQFLGMSPAASRDAVNLCVDVVSSCADRARAAWLVALWSVDVCAGAANLTVPTTVIVGEKDRLIPPVVARRMADIIEATGNLDRYVELPGIGHCMNLESVDAFNQEIERLTIRRLRPRRKEQAG